MATMKQLLKPIEVQVAHLRYRCKAGHSGCLLDGHTTKTDSIDRRQHKCFFGEHSSPPLYFIVFLVFEWARYERGKKHCSGRRCPKSFWQLVARLQLLMQSRRGKARTWAAWIRSFCAIFTRTSESDILVHRQRGSITKCQRGCKSQRHATVPPDKAKRSKSIPRRDATGHDGLGYRRPEPCDCSPSGDGRGPWKNRERGVGGSIPTD